MCKNFWYLNFILKLVGDDTITITNSMDEEANDFKSSNSMTWKLIFDGDKENKENWVIHLLQHAADHRRWKKAATTKMEILSPAKAMAKDRSTSSLGNNEPLYERVTLKTNTLTRRATVKKTKSFKRTRSKLALIYNQTGDNDVIDDKSQQVLI